MPWAEQIQNYAKRDINEQFSIKNKTGMVPLGIQFAQWEPIEVIGLTAPASFVNKVIEDAREDLIDSYYEADYYYSVTKPLITGDIYERVLDSKLDSDFIAYMVYFNEYAILNHDFLKGYPRNEDPVICW